MPCIKLVPGEGVYMKLLNKAFMVATVFLFATVSLYTQATVIKATQCVTSDATAMSGDPVATSIDSDECVGILYGDKNGGEVNYEASHMNTAKPGTVHTSYEYDAASLDVDKMEPATPWTPGAFGRVGWQDVTKFDKGDEDSPSGEDYGLDVSVVGTTLTWSTTTELNGTWVVLVKQSREVVLYLFENLVKTTTGSVELNRFANPGWSHVSLISGPSNQVPVPGSLGLFSLGLASMLWIRRRRAS